MSSFYTNVFQYGNKIHIRGYDKGIRIKKAIEYQPYLFLANKNGDYKTLDGRSASKKDFKTIKEAKDFIEKYKEINNLEIYGLNQFEIGRAHV